MGDGEWPSLSSSDGTGEGGKVQCGEWGGSLHKFKVMDTELL